MWINSYVFRRVLANSKWYSYIAISFFALCCGIGVYPHPLLKMLGFSSFPGAWEAGGRESGDDSTTALPIHTVAPWDRHVQPKCESAGPLLFFQEALWESKSQCHVDYLVSGEEQGQANSCSSFCSGFDTCLLLKILCQNLQTLKAVPVEWSSSLLAFPCPSLIFFSPNCRKCEGNFLICELK